MPVSFGVLLALSWCLAPVNCEFFLLLFFLHIYIYFSKLFRQCDFLLTKSHQ